VATKRRPIAGEVVNPGLNRRADQVIAVEGPTIKTIADMGSSGAPPADVR